MADRSSAVFGLYGSFEAAQRGLEALLAAGFASGDIALLGPDSAGEVFARRGRSRAPEGATAGATAGAVAGGTLGVLAGLGALSAPIVGPALAAGALMAGLAGLGVGGASGGLVGALVGLGIREPSPLGWRAQAVREGGMLLSVYCASAHAASRAKRALRASWAEDIAAVARC